MKILIDENMPFAEEFFADMAKIERFPGRALSPQQLEDADVLLVRSITKVNAPLLANANKLKFVGTATIGEDHIDKAELARRNIAFSSAPGCNAVSVAEYVISALLVLAEKYHFFLADKTVAIVGVGNIGRALQARLEVLGCRLLLVDPIRREQEGPDSGFIELEQALAEADIVTLHTPLTREGAHPTYHFIDEKHLALLKDDVCLINACRGAVLDNQALLACIRERARQGQSAIKLVMDVWEGEPEPLRDLLPYVDIATAHIAGYSLEGKTRGTEILYQQVCHLFGMEANKCLTKLLPEARFPKLTINPESEFQSELKSLVHLVYDVRRDDGLFRAHLDGKGFDWLRKNYPIRREWSSLRVASIDNSPSMEKIFKLGFAI